MTEPSHSQFALFLAAGFVLAVTPGPGIFYVAAARSPAAVREGVASSFGTGLGGMVHVLAGSLGVSAMVLASAELFTALKLVGAAYLVWLGLRTIRAARRDALASAERLDRPRRLSAPRRAFREGVLVEALNPEDGRLLPGLRAAVRGSSRGAAWRSSSPCWG